MCVCVSVRKEIELPATDSSEQSVVIYLNSKVATLLALGRGHLMRMFCVRACLLCPHVRFNANDNEHTAVHLTGAKSISCLQAFYIFIFIFSAHKWIFSSLFSMWTCLFPALDVIGSTIRAPTHRFRNRSVVRTTWCRRVAVGWLVAGWADWLETCELFRVWQSFCVESMLRRVHPVGTNIYRLQHSPLFVMIYALNRSNVVAIMHIKPILFFRIFDRQKRGIESENGKKWMEMREWAQHLTKWIPIRMNGVAWKGR